MVVHLDAPHGGQLRVDGHPQREQERQTTGNLYRIREGGENRDGKTWWVDKWKLSLGQIIRFAISEDVTVKQ